jgi:hypothetical protein
MRFAALVLAGRLLLSQSDPSGNPVLEPPTLHSLGVYWIVRGDANRDGAASVDYRAEGSSEWRAGAPLFAVEKGAHLNGSRESLLDVPPDGRLLAGSIVGLRPNTAYELQIKLGGVERRLSARTAAEPTVPKDAPVLHVRPGEGGGRGSAADPCRGLKEAQDRAKPGDVILVHAGAYKGAFRASKSGEPGRPIVWRGAGDGEAAIDGEAPGRGIGIEANGIHDVWFEQLTVRNVGRGLTAQNSARLVIRRCRFHSLDQGIVCTANDRKVVEGFLIADNVLEGPFSWSMPAKDKGAKVIEHRGIQITGAGHDVGYNRVRGFKDGIDTFPSPRCAAIDIHHNDISECMDDGIELDDSERNVRCFENRLTNIFQGISVQPVHGGPAYVFRNVLYNVMLEPFKMHNSPSGVLFYHNTIVKKGSPSLLLTPQEVRNCVSRNNLFVGSAGAYACDNEAPMTNCDFDYDGFGGGPWTLFAKWNGARYATLQDVKAKAPVYRHAVLVDPESVFESGLKAPPDPDREYDRQYSVKLKPGTAAIDAGEILPGFNDGFAGKAPDLGALEAGGAPPSYGPRPEK